MRALRHAEANGAKLSATPPSTARRLEDLAGIRPELLRSIQCVGILTVESLVANADTPRGRMFLAERTGLTARQILDIINLADLTRIEGITDETVAFLRSLGIHSVSDLAAADLGAILESLSVDDDMDQQEVFAIEGLLATWIAQARHIRPLLD
jgi:predicted RecB family nuclease